MVETRNRQCVNVVQVQKKKVAAARTEYERVAKKSKPGSGKRFSALAKSIEAEGKSPESAQKIAASIGRKKYGASKMSKMATSGRKRKK